MIFLLQTKISDLLETQKVGKRFEDLKPPKHSETALENFHILLYFFVRSDLEADFGVDFDSDISKDILGLSVHFGFSNLLNINTYVCIVEKNKSIFDEYLDDYTLSISKDKAKDKPKAKAKKNEKAVFPIKPEYITYEMILDTESLFVAEVLHLRNRPISELVFDFPILALLCSKLKQKVFLDFWTWFEKDSVKNGRSSSEMDRFYKKFHGFTTDYGSFFTNTEIGTPYKMLLEKILSDKKQPFKWNSNTFSFQGIENFQEFAELFDLDEKLFFSSIHLFEAEVKASKNNYSKSFPKKNAKEFSMETNLTKDASFVEFCEDYAIKPVFLTKRLVRY